MTDAPPFRCSLSVFTLYADPGAATDWLAATFGFEVVNRFADDDGVVIHAELRRDDAVVIVEAAAPGQSAAPVVDHSTVRAPYLILADEAQIDALHQTAVAAGATSVRSPERTQWGNYRCELLDPEGHQWSFGTYVPGQSW